MGAVESCGIADVVSMEIEAFSSVELRALVGKPVSEDAASDLVSGMRETKNHEYLSSLLKGSL